jgi:hypothetical protein
MQTTSMHTPARRGGALVRTVGRRQMVLTVGETPSGNRTRTLTPTDGSTGRGSRRSELVPLTESTITR